MKSKITRKDIAQASALPNGKPAQFVIDKRDEFVRQQRASRDAIEGSRTQDQQAGFRDALGKHFRHSHALPPVFKSQIENLSGIDLSEVRVHYNSLEPGKIGAAAYAQGNDIHLAPNQEKHLPHEAWHIVQQRQGRVEPTTSFGGMAVNDSVHLEQEADVMGARAMRGDVPNATALQTGHNATVMPKQMYMETLVRIAEYLGVEATVNKVAEKLGMPPGALIAGLIFVGTTMTLALAWSVPKLIRWLTGNNDLHHEKMTQDRGLKEYRDAFYYPGHGVTEAVAALNGNDTWVDMGTGTGKALVDLYGERTNQGGVNNIPRMVGIGVEKPEGFALDRNDIQDRISYQQNYLHKIPDHNLGGTGQVSLITDYSGVATYTRDLQETILRYGTLLRVGGKAIIRLQRETGYGENKIRMNTFQQGSNDVGPDVWLAGATGFTVNCKPWVKGMKSWIIELIRNAQPLSVPDIECVSYDESQQPPIRVFRIG